MNDTATNSSNATTAKDVKKVSHPSRAIRRRSKKQFGKHITLREFNAMIRGVQLVEVFCKATTVAGKEEEIKVVVPYHKLKGLHGNGISSFSIYELYKKGTTTTKDLYGNTYAYRLGRRFQSTENLTKKEEN